jgi:hypothetical protein
MPTTHDPGNQHMTDDEDEHPPQDILGADGRPRRLSRRCLTCIFRGGNKMQLCPGRLQDMLRTCNERDGFVVCHEILTYGSNPDFGPAMCAGYYDHPQATQTTLVQLADRLDAWVVVDPPGEGESQ